MKRIFRVAAVLAAAAFANHVWSAGALDEAQSLIDQGQYERALSTLDAHLQKVPHDAEARFTRGLVLVKLGRNDDAVKAFSDLTRDYPQLPEPYNNLAVLYAQRGDYEKARDALEAALATHPSYATAHENLGDIYAALAAAAYNRALMLDQDNGIIRQKLRLLEQMDTLPAGEALPSLASAPPSSGDTPAAAAGAAPATATPGAAATTPPATDAAPATPALTAEVAESISQAVYDWSAAWSQQNVPAYLAAYDPGFVPEDGLSRAQWEAQRRERVGAPGNIEVKVINPQIDLLAPDRARVVFEQAYSSNTYSDRVTKVLELRQRDGRWLITRESVI